MTNGPFPHPESPFHGTGCALSAAIAAHLARGAGVPEAVGRAHEFLQHLVRGARALGRGALVLDPRNGRVQHNTADERQQS